MELPLLIVCLGGRYAGGGCWSLIFVICAIFGFRLILALSEEFGRVFPFYIVWKRLCLVELGLFCLDTVSGIL